MLENVLREKEAELQKAAETWARENSLLEPGEEIVVTIEVRQSSPASLSVKAFFSRDRLVALGATKVVAGGVWPALERATRHGWARESRLVHTTARQFLSEFSEETLLRIDNLGKIKVALIMKALEEIR